MKESLKGAEVAGAVLEYIRNNDVAVLEGFDKVRRCPLVWERLP